MKNSTWSGTCLHCGCPIQGVHYEGCKRYNPTTPYARSSIGIEDSIQQITLNQILPINEVYVTQEIAVIVNKVNELVCAFNKLNKLLN